MSVLGEQVVVEVTGAAGPAEAASGEVARLLGDAFVAARDAMLGRDPGGGVLLRCTVGSDSAALVGGVTSLCRSLAREAAPRGVRVNAIIAAAGTDVAALVAFLGAAASAMCTGAVLEAR